MLNVMIFLVFKLYVLNMVTPDDGEIPWLRGLSAYLPRRYYHVEPNTNQ